MPEHCTPSRRTSAGLAFVIWVPFVILSACVVEPPPGTRSNGSSASTPGGETAASVETVTATNELETDGSGLAHDPASMPEVQVQNTRLDAERSMNHLPPRFHLGSTPSQEMIDAWDIDVMPDGTGLPEGKGSVADGATIYRQQCESCHGVGAEGGRYEALAGREPREGFPFSEDPGLRYTIGNYWPYATTLFDYVRRAMPQAVPGSLTADQTYALVAYLLYLNELLPEDAVLDRDSLVRVVMPARDRFVVDDRRGGTELR